MANDPSQDILKALWSDIPQSVRDIVLSGKDERSVREAASTYGLDADGLASLQLEALYVLLGCQTVEDFEREILQHPALTKEQGVEFVRKIRNDLFAQFSSQLPHTPQAEGTGTRVGLATIAAAIETYGLVRERLERLPKNVQATIQSPTLEDALRNLLAKYQLSPEHATVFVAEATRVMVGLTTTNNFKMEVTRVTALDPNTLDALFFDTETALFKPVRMAIMQALEQRQGTQPQAPITPAAPVPVPKPSAAAQTADPYREPIR